MQLAAILLRRSAQLPGLPFSSNAIIRQSTLPCTRPLGLRFFAEASPQVWRTDNIVSTSEANVGKLAGAVAARIRHTGWCNVDCVGAKPSYSALKAIKIATGYLAAEGGFAGKTLAIHPIKDILAAKEAPSGRQTRTALMRFHVRPMSTPIKEEEPELILIGTDTNAGLAAALVSKVLETKGAAVLTGMGHQAMSQAVKTILVAQTYMLKSGTLDDKVVFGAVRTETFKEGDEDRVRMVLSCKTMDRPEEVPALELPSS
eukprot:TRINITY_DN108956_c0_g1_i1.p1 TRINITY_DN108956_c0_g1~~TRINITY_DN108956_c0_g1_i1.p1  ORF type:complete len:259 (-),score=62.33 TRINITY_DN108956_c0_g1_i1:40-816(-)